MRPSRTRRAFTLVEMLVVIIIIGILAAILVPTIGMAIRRTKNATMVVEMKQIESAIVAYAADHNNDQPPDFTSREAVEAHMKRGYARNRFNVSAWLVSAPAAGPDPRNLDAAEAIVFWLSRTKNNTQNPITGSGEPKVYFEFKPEQLTDIDNDGWQEYVPKHSPGGPYVYFDGRVLNTDLDGTAGGSQVPTSLYAFATYPARYTASNPMPASPNPSIARQATFIPPAVTPPATMVRPYRSSDLMLTAADLKTWPNDAGTGSPVHNTAWVNEGEFQIIMPGLDNEFGTDNVVSGGLIFKRFPTPNYYADPNVEDEAGVSDRDNLVNFSEGKTVGDSVP